ncbi:calcium-binding protein [Paracoccus sp. DMF-8]|uniref:calcium-binding protein n=1 Tax=Paracoccus sp. DMF-8 TaxID=3019445 RepID=UPI0023E8B15B|nr:calcium-binding protein [Paracoccus sp. DMF-8]MDF3606797.1 calcium-binding protein [Paracoccus sp. DMF-8]
MATILGSSNGAGVRYTVNGGQSLVPDYALINSTTSDGIQSLVGGNHVWVRGTVSGNSNAIQLGDGTTDFANRLIVDQGGFLSGTYAARIYGDQSSVTNAGVISGSTYGVYFVGSAGQSQSLTNTGQIFGTGAGLSISGASNFSLTNTGIIQGTVSIMLGTGNDMVRNTGTLIGDVQLGAGNDVFDGRGGTVIGNILGGDGNDRLINSANAETFDGGAGVDVVNLAGSAGAIVFLDGRECGGSATGDSYLNVENVVGSAYGADRITGNASNNLLNGRGGNDFLFGAAGNDQLIGGEGVDTLRGGAGNDVFVFQSLDDIGDVIQDFGRGMGNNDVIRIVGSAFGGGLTAGVLAAGQFRTGNFNTGQDADDRFILRSTDKTLWFDVDGAGGAASVMVADLQNNALFNQLDILIV